MPFTNSNHGKTFVKGTNLLDFGYEGDAVLFGASTGRPDDHLSAWGQLVSSVQLSSIFITTNLVPRLSVVETYHIIIYQVIPALLSLGVSMLSPLCLMPHV
jgi:hypothetical protein